MNGYVITYEGKRYGTNADNVQEAEDKFWETFSDLNPDSKSTISLVCWEEGFDIMKDEFVFF